MTSFDYSLTPPYPTDRLHRWPSLHPLHAFLLAGAVTLFIGGFLSDLAYFTTSEIQWKNFTSWLLVGGLVFIGFSILWALVDVFRARASRTRPLIYLVLLIVVFLLGFFNELVHAKDAWATMPEGLVLSVIGAVLAIAANVLGFSTLRTGALR